jgi:hypothetical protein
MVLYYKAAYEYAQRYNGSALNKYIVAYLANIKIGFSESQVNAVRAFIDERDVHDIKQSSVMWITNMQWMAFRIFFIAHFVRSIIFQIRRKVLFASVLIPPLFFVLVLFAACLFAIQELGIFGIGSPLYQQNSFYLFFVVIVVAYYRFLARSLLAVSEAVLGDWYKFHELNIPNAMASIMESYSNKFDQWRGRFRGRVGAPGVGA